jgi:hypothetical protein
LLVSELTGFVAKQAMKTTGRGTPNRRHRPGNRAQGAEDRNRFSLISWAAKQEKFQPHGTFFLARNSRFLSGRRLDDLVTQLGGFPLEVLDLKSLVFNLVEGCSSVHVFHPVAQHAVDQASQLGRHGLDRDGSTQFGSQPAELRP